MIASDELREVSPVGKEMIDRERVVQDVAVALSRASSVPDAVVVPPARKKTWDAQRKKAVTEQINLHGMADIQGESVIVFVTDEMDPWQRVESHAVQKTMRARCITHRVDKLHAIIAKHPELEELIHKFPSS